jgi:hypothetical protein
MAAASSFQNYNFFKSGPNCDSPCRKINFREIGCEHNGGEKNISCHASGIDPRSPSRQPVTLLTSVL